MLIVDLLTRRATASPERTVYRHLATGDCDGEIEEISFSRLMTRSRAIAASLQEHGLAGSRALLIYSPGLEFICSYFGCLSAGVVAVPGVPPRRGAQNHRALTRMKRVIVDSDAKVILGDHDVIDSLGAMTGHLPELAGITCVDTEDIPDEAAASWCEPRLTADSVACLQYTSGSTSAPRGVVVTHGNLIDNQRVITERMGHTAKALEEHGHEAFVSWLPLFHDMGLFGPVLNTLYIGGTTTLFSPLHFLQKPGRWPTAISRYRPHTSGGPNFAYELAIRHATAELLVGLDLSSWKVAFNGAEPVRAGTLRRFAEAFAPTGFRSEALYPCYGLAEATLMVTGGTVDTPPVLPESDGGVVGCGQPGEGVTVVIADPDVQQERPEGEVGEIWVQGASVAKGYWRNAIATRESFRATVTGREGYFLRTGDLGFLRDGELSVTGRLKDLIVIDGRNHYPQDLEFSAEDCHPALRPGCTAAFSVDIGRDGERPVLMAEVVREAADESEKITDLIRAAIGEAHGLSLHDVVLVYPGTIPKTTSGKIQRQASRAAYLDSMFSRISASTSG